MEGTIIIRKRTRNRVNRFTADTYDAICKELTGANKEPGVVGGVIVKHNIDQGQRLSPIIIDVLALNGIPRSTIKKKGKYNSSNRKWHFLFDSNDTAYAAMDVINKMALPDTINRSRVSSTGLAESNSGLKVNVDVERGDDGEMKLREGTTFIPTNTSSAETIAAAASSSTTKWLVIGVALVAVVAIVLIIVKKKK